MNTVLEGLSEARPELVGQSLAQQLPADAVARLRELLLQELAVQIDLAEGQLRSAVELSPDPDTPRGRFDVDWELAEVLVGWSEEAIENTERALTRLREGRFGRCEQCSVPIPLQRLKAIPHARFCVPCEARRDAMR